MIALPICLGHAVLFIVIRPFPGRILTCSVWAVESALRERSGARVSAVLRSFRRQGCPRGSHVRDTGVGAAVRLGWGTVRLCVALAVGIVAATCVPGGAVFAWVLNSRVGMRVLAPILLAIGGVVLGRGFRHGAGQRVCMPKRSSWDCAGRERGVGPVASLPGGSVRLRNLTRVDGAVTP